ncbi:hypothetical protein BUALT_Bualt07G0147000 [Buddleja alternifolia]|uniref:RNase H type-1 domain-containing protein n=1 Tax=Buddleja alternifolia TaxID=168488 RepID=A0AAV6XC36_9LAMI|nr:hypothetical protein BUALT_Bualt07G0147000 [Buddleja alternifolia]
MHEESDSHILLHCDLARQIWSLSNIPWIIIADWSDSAHDWIRKVTEEERKLFLILCWAIWSARNKMLWEKIQPNPLSIVLGVRSYLDAFSKINLSSCLSSPGKSVPSRWTRPTSDIIKLNFDGAILSQVGGAGLGVVARNSNGECLAWLMRFVPHIYDPETAEAMAAREAIDLARRHGWDHIVVEGDCCSQGRTEV